jgi:hypothetical protein
MRVGAWPVVSVKTAVYVELYHSLREIPSLGSLMVTYTIQSYRNLKLLSTRNIAVRLTLSVVQLIARNANTSVKMRIRID